MAPKRLTVELNGKRIGEISTGSSTSLRYDPHYSSAASRVSLSLSLPSSVRNHAEPNVTAWLWGLLPDSRDVLRLWAREHDASLADPTSYLATPIGLDCPGAARFYPSEVEPVFDSGVEWLSDQEAEKRISVLISTRNNWFGGYGSGQFSLAGAQTKTALRRDSQGRWGVPFGDEPTTHILKPAISGFEDQHINEHLCLEAGRVLGLAAAQSTIETFGQNQVLSVTRFDRHKTADGGRWQRIHQEDFCQALSVHPDFKYEADGGPTAADMATLIRHHSTASETDLSRFADALIFNWIIAGTDGHAKNYALLHTEGSTRLAPLYDIASMLTYDDSQEHKVKLAMKIGGEYRTKRIGKKAWQKAAKELGIPAAKLLARCEALCIETPKAFTSAAEQYEKSDAFVSKKSAMPALLSDRVATAASRCLEQLSDKV